MKLIPIASDGWRFILPAVIFGVVLMKLGDVWAVSLAGIAFLFAAFVAFFFRDADRDTVQDPNIIYSPGDGRVLAIEPQATGPHQGWQLVRIFLSVLNGHIQRSPIEGIVENVQYKPGLFLDARNPQAHIQNEQNTVTIKSSAGSLVVTQIAELIARRIVCWAKPGQRLGQGERYGLIRFGSQVDVLFPPNTEVTVHPGEKVVGGRTVLGRWKK